MADLFLDRIARVAGDSAAVGRDGALTLRRTASAIREDAPKLAECGLPDAANRLLAHADLLDDLAQALEAVHHEQAAVALASQDFTPPVGLPAHSRR